MKNDVDAYLKKKGIKEEELGMISQKALKVFRQIKGLHRLQPDNEDILEKLEKAGANAIEIISKDFPDPAPREKKTKSKSSSTKAKEVKEKTPLVLDELAKCRTLIKKDREKKIASGEIKAPKKTTRYTKLKNSFLRILKLVPSDTPEILEKAFKELVSTSRAVFKIHGLKQAHLIEKALKEVYQKRLEKLTQKED